MPMPRSWTHSVSEFLKKYPRDVLILINVRGDIDSVIQGLKSCDLSNHHLLFFNIRLPSAARDMSWSTSLSEDYLTQSDYETIDRSVFENGDPLPDYSSQKVLIPIRKNKVVLERALNKHKVSGVVILEDTNELIDVARGLTQEMNMLCIGHSFHPAKNKIFRCRQYVRNFVSKTGSFFLDHWAFFKYQRRYPKKPVLWMDHRIHRSVEKGGAKLPLIPCILENGIGIRRRWLAEFGSYISVRHQRFLGRGFVKGIILRNDVKELEKSLVLTAKSLRIPTYVLQHGVLAEVNGHSKITADHFLAWGEASREWYQQHGESGEKILIVGNPHFDALSEWLPSLSKEEVCERLHLDSGKGIVTFIPQQVNKFSSFWTDDIFHVMAEMLLECMKKYPDKQVVIKADPYEDLEPYLKLKGRIRKHAAVVKHFPLYDLLNVSDLVVTMDSTVGLEAMFFKKPLITMNLTPRPDRVPFAQSGTALAAHDKASLSQAIHKILSQPSVRDSLIYRQKAFIQSHIYKMDGGAKGRLLSVINA